MTQIEDLKSELDKIEAYIISTFGLGLLKKWWLREK